MDTIKKEKIAIRRTMFKLRKSLDGEYKLNYDSFICEELDKLIVTNKFQYIHAYIPIAYEIDISPLLEHLLKVGKTVVCPKTLPQRRLENRVLFSLEDLELGVMKTQHPRRKVIYDGPFDLIIVPGLAFDSNNYRVGYGGGYYDNFISAHPEALKVGVFYPFQKIEKVPVEEHDMTFDQILMR
ncbi:MAG: 5-formyltetrahydrofolate cyclo-ligase [Bacteroidetes bacterium]|nr:5-formyltetrahydrofolate cyclo-ligase [Bacteroidota bacterium]